MILDSRQRLFVDQSLDTVWREGSALSVAPTGSGKSVMLGGMVKDILAEKPRYGRVLVSQHWGKLAEQNRARLREYDPGIRSGLFVDSEKTPDAEAVYGMIKSLLIHRDMLPPFDALLIDEAHHAASNEYAALIAFLKSVNPDLWVQGVTATPNRGDGKPLNAAFAAVGDVITLFEMLQTGRLVPPRTLDMDLGNRGEVAAAAERDGNSVEQTEVARVMNRPEINCRVVEEWAKHARKRFTLVFAPTVDHAQDLAAEFCRQGYSAAMVCGVGQKMSKRQLEGRLKAFHQRQIQILVCAFLLTEGFDATHVGCVVLLRRGGSHPAFVQMVGRGLRKLDARLYPDMVKGDCLVLDFGGICEKFGTLESLVNLEGRLALAKRRSEGRCRCRECKAEMPAGGRVCLLCGAELIAGGKAKEEVAELLPEEIVLIERMILDDSPFKWETVVGKDGSQATAAYAWDSWALALESERGEWMAVGSAVQQPVRLLQRGDRIQVLASADRFLRPNRPQK